MSGLHLPYRLAVQLGPQLLILLPYLPRILRYIASIPSYEPSAGELRLAEMESLKKVNLGGASLLGGKFCSKSPKVKCRDDISMVGLVYIDLDLKGMFRDV